MSTNLTTEGRNPSSDAIDTLSAMEIVRLMNSEDAEAVGHENVPPAITRRTGERQGSLPCLEFLP